MKQRQAAWFAAPEFWEALSCHPHTKASFWIRALLIPMLYCFYSHQNGTGSQRTQRLCAEYLQRGPGGSREPGASASQWHKQQLVGANKWFLLPPDRAISKCHGYVLSSLFLILSIFMDILSLFWAFHNWKLLCCRKFSIFWAFVGETNPRERFPGSLAAKTQTCGSSFACQKQ